mgnify:CR=1 FL=1
MECNIEREHELAQAKPSGLASALLITRGGRAITG